MATTNIKIFVLDTNVLLHDYKCIYNFQDNDIVIPIVALEELDKFKKGNDALNFNARECTRELDELIGKKDPTQGITIGEGKGKLYMALGQKYPDLMKVSFPEPTPDHRILAIADSIRSKFPDRKVVVVSKDINLRVKAKALGIAAEDYTTDKVQNMEKIYKGIDVMENVDPELINRIYQDKSGVDVDAFNFDREIFAHEYLILKAGTKSALTHYDPVAHRIGLVEKRKVFGIEPRNSEQALALDALMRPEINLMSLTGKAGTGKTLLALAAALQQTGLYEQIFVARPIVPLSNQDLGFLPGTIKEKIGPYMLPLFDNLGVIKHQFNANSKEIHKIDEMLKDERLLITPLAYIRGRSLSNAFFIIDEAQNLTPHEVKTIVTRAGENVKIVFTGDIQQIDSPYLDTTSNGLSYLTDKMKGQNLFAHMNLVKGERSALAELASDLL